MTEFAARDYCARLLGLGKRKTSRTLGPPDAIVINASNRQTALWRIGRVYAIREYVTLPHVKEPAQFYSWSAISKATGGQRFKVKAVLGECDAVQITLNKEIPIFSEQSASAVWQLSAESPEAFARKYAFVPRVSAKRQRIMERIKARDFSRLKRPASYQPWFPGCGRIKPGVTIVRNPRHRWAENPGPLQNRA